MGHYYTPNNLDPTGMAEFVVVGEVVAEQGADDENSSEKAERKTGAYLGISHVDVFYDGTEIRAGFAGPVNPKEKRDVSKNKKWTLARKDSGALRWGVSAGKTCKCATDEDIVSCIKSAPKPRRSEYSITLNNCQHDVVHATSGCCLSGYSPIYLSAPNPYFYWTDKERAEFHARVQASLDKNRWKLYIFAH